MPNVETPLQGVGTWEAELLTYDPALNAELLPFREVWFLEGEAHRYTQLITKVPNENSLTVGGHGLAYHLGFGQEGPIVKKRRRFSGRNKLANELFNFDPFPDLYWKTSEDSFWDITSGQARVGTETEDDDALIYEESFHAEPGDELQAEIDINRDGGIVGRLRPQIIFDGIFKPPDEIEGDGEFLSEDPWDFTPAEYEIVDGVLRARSINNRPLLNGNLEAGTLANWTPSPNDGTFAASTSDPISGDYSLLIDLTVSDGHREIESDEMSTKGSDRWKFEFVADSLDATAALHYYLITDPDGDRVHIIDDVTEPDEFDGGSRTISKEITIPDGQEGMAVIFGVHGSGHTGEWKIDSVALTRLEGNTARLKRLEPFPVIAGRTYEVNHLAFFDKPSGSFWWQFRCSADGRPDVVLKTTEHGPKDDEEAAVLQAYEGSVTIPSGYDTARLEYVTKDVFGGYLWISHVTVKDTDLNTRVIQGKSQDDGSETLTFTATAPSGTEAVRFQVVAEIHSLGWEVTRADLRFINVDIATVQSVAEDVLIHPDTDLPLPLAGLGTVHDPTDAIGRDWLIINKTNREILDDLCTIYAPGHEWEITPDGYLHVINADDYYEDSTVFVFDNDPLGQPPSSDENAEDYLTDLDVMGAERSGGVVSGTATQEARFTDWRGNGIRRRAIIEDSQIDHPDLADSVASEQLSSRNRERKSVSLQVGDWRAYGELRTGQHMPVWSPRAGIEGDDEVPGPFGPAFPELIRVTNISHELGAGWKALLRTGETTFVDITDSILWGTTQATIEAGDPPPSFVFSPEGGAYASFIRYRASRA